MPNCYSCVMPNMKREIDLIQGVDVGALPPTPTKSFFQNFRITALRDQMIAYASRYGFPISYVQEQKGNLVQNIFPIKKNEVGQISTSSKVQLNLHTEAAFHPYKPSAVLLLCLRGDPEAATTFAYVDEIVQHLSPMTISTLTRPWFVTSIDESFRTQGESNVEVTLSILKEDGPFSNPVYELTYDETLMKAVNSQAEDALHELKDVIDKCTYQVFLEQGDLLVLNNKTTIHGRTPFQPRYDGTDRWVQRILAIDTVVPRAHKVGHMIITQFNDKSVFTAL